MNVKKLFLVMAVAVMSVGSVSAQGDFFFAFNEDDANADASANFNIGDTGQLWVYWSTNGPNDSDLNVGAFIDVFSSNIGVIEFTAAETFDYQIEIPGHIPGNRLLNASGGGGSFGPALGGVADNFIDELAAVTVTGGDGIREVYNGAGVGLDTGYNASNDGFEWALIEFTAIGAGTTDVTGASGDGLIVNNGFEIPAVFTTATITVGSGVPEPTAAGLLALGLAGIAARRRR